MRFTEDGMLVTDDDLRAAPEALEVVEAFVRRYVVLTSAQSCALALWIAHTHAIEAADVTPYIAGTSAEKRSGKTRLLEVLELVVAEALRAANLSDAYLFRSLSEHRRTLLIDEADAIFGKHAEREDLRGLLNAGYRRGAVVGRCETVGRKVVTRDYDAFGPKALAAIGDLPDTIADRSIPIRLQRKHRRERVERFRLRDATREGHDLRDALADLFADSTTVEILTDARPSLPEALGDREQDGWEPLLAIADLVGGDWPARARAAAVELQGDSVEAEETLGILCLRHIREAFAEIDREYLTSAELLESLCEREDGPWAGWWARDVEDGRTKGPASRLARILKPYGIRSQKVGPRDSRAQGYDRRRFTDTWARYLDEADAPEDVSDPSPPVSDSEDGHMDNPRSDGVFGSGGGEANTASDLHVSECLSFETDTDRTGSDTGSREPEGGCCEGGSLELRCQLCPKSPTYYEEETS